MTKSTKEILVEVAKILEQRDGQYGGFQNVALASQKMKLINRYPPQLDKGGEGMLGKHSRITPKEAIQKEALDNIAQKMARIACGNSHADNWLDIIGYAIFALQALNIKD